MNKIYGVFYYTDAKEPILLREFRSYRAALIHKMEMCEQTSDFNFMIMERDLSDWRPVHEYA